MESTIFKKRLSWVDNVKMVAMLFVIFGNTWRIIHYPLPEWVGLFILSFNMALLVMMTGYTILLIKLFMKYELTQAYCLGEIR